MYTTPLPKSLKRFKNIQAMDGSTSIFGNISNNILKGINTRNIYFRSIHAVPNTPNVTKVIIKNIQNNVVDIQHTNLNITGVKPSLYGFYFSVSTSSRLPASYKNQILVTGSVSNNTFQLKGSYCKGIVFLCRATRKLY